MRLCIVTHTVAQGDGQGRVNYEIAQAAIRDGHQVILVSTSVAPELQQHPQVIWIPIPVKHLPSHLLQELAFSWQSATWLRYHHSDFDLLHVNGAITSIPADVNAAHFVHHAWLQSPYHSCHRRNIYGLYQWAYTAINAYWEKRAFRRARRVVAVSESLKQDLLKLSIPTEQIRVIGNGVDLEEFSPGVVNRSSLGLPESVPLALFVGDIRTNRKNLDTVLAALVEVPKLHLGVVGSPSGSPYPALAEQLGIHARIHFLGYRTDIPDLMRAADLFVFPSRYEPFGMVITEAMATGLPVITAQTTGAATLVTPDCGVVLADSEDVLALAQSLQELVKHPHRCQAMGKAARSIAEQHSWQQMGQQYLDLFLELAGASAARTDQAEVDPVVTPITHPASQVVI